MSTPTPPPTPSPTPSPMLASILASDPALAVLAQTWPAFQGDVDTQALDTDMLRIGYPKPTIIREHETIHDLCNLVDNLRRELAEAKNATSRSVYRVDADQDGFTAPLAYVLDPDEAEAIAATVPDNRGHVISFPLITLTQWQQVMAERRQTGL